MKKATLSQKPGVVHKQKLLILLAIFTSFLLVLFARVFYIQFVQAPALRAQIYEQQTRDRLISPNRGRILDRNGVAMAETETVASVSVVHNQIQDAEGVSRILAEKLGLDYETVLAKVNKRVALNRIQTKAEKPVADGIRALNLPGVKVDEDTKRFYPFSTLAAQVIGFAGKDNQGIIGLEAKYNSYLEGASGKILTQTDIKGREVFGGQEVRVEPTPGHTVMCHKFVWRA